MMPFATKGIEWLAVSCPRCAAQIVVADDGNADVVRCHCGKEFQAKAARSLLDWLEIKLRRMTVGTFVFVFRRIPAGLYDLAAGLLRGLAAFCRWLVPFSWKLARVTVWLSLWLGLLVGPTLFLGRVLPLLAPRSALPGLLATGWLVLAVSGSIWGFFHYRRRKVALVGTPHPPLPACRHNGGHGTVAAASPLPLKK
jgi:ribosomal protein S27AE